MAKKFAARVSKKQRTKIDTLSKLDTDIFRLNDEKLLKGAQLDNIRLDKINVRKQVRTKFNDESIKELADNIRENGLIQPLVIHREGSKFVLICGERRFRAMTTIADFDMAPCFILENKTDQELMAIQFSENSAREQLHYIDQADSIYGYKTLTGNSERKIQAALGISKSEVHRCILIAKIPKPVKEAAKIHNTEKYVLLEWDALEAGAIKTALKKDIVNGAITKRTQLKKAITNTGAVRKASKKSIRVPRKQSASANLFIKAMKEKTKDMELDKDTQKLLKKLMEESKDLIDM